MKNTQRESVYKTEEFEDLTLFANESFDTQDVDLFEFSIEESSPLTRLKSIILSLDWEINDEILQELADELDNLQNLWEGDKVAEVYLQGLAKIGSYIRSKGAYAHPNSIKLLLTFFYNFEKIISSENITGEQITQLLKGDVRKFKILQYQINQAEASAPDNIVAQLEVARTDVLPTATEEASPSKQLKATILSLDWEVTDESLAQFNDRLSRFREVVSANKPATVLLQGLQALGDYIAEERADAHPEAFLLLHSFFEALEQITEVEQPLAQEQVQSLLVDRINRLNNLKLLIAPPTAIPASDARIEEMVDEISAPAADVEEPLLSMEEEDEQPFPAALFDAEPEDRISPFPVTAADSEADQSLAAELDDLFGIDAKPAMETSDLQYPDEILPPDAIHPVEDELADDFIEAHLSTKRGLMPALSDAGEVSGFSEEAEPLDLPAQSDLTEQLDLLFADTDEEEVQTTGHPASEDEELTIEGETGLESQPVAALSEIEEEGEILEQQQVMPVAEDENFLDIQNKLDNFFADAETVPAIDESPALAPVDDIEQSLFFGDENDIQPALAGSDEERGFSEQDEAAGIEVVPIEEIEEKLDFFFGAEEPEIDTLSEVTEETMPHDLVSEGFQELAEIPSSDVPPALEDIEQSLEFSEELEPAESEEKDLELIGALDSFFEETGADHSEIIEQGADAEVDQLTQALEETMTAEAAAVPVADKEVALSSLGALLPVLIRAPSPETVRDVAQMAVALQKVSWPAEQQCLADLLSSTLTLAVRLPTRDSAATEQLVNFLFTHLREPQCRQDTLMDGVARFTAWLQGASECMPLIPKAASGAEEGEGQPAYTAKELYFELAELRNSIREEFTRLRHDLHHHRH